MNLSIKTIASWTIFLLILMQFIPLNRINPNTVSDIAAPETVKKTLKKACYDCHSFETNWTGIAYIAPLSWLASWKVASGRHALNFSILGKATKTDSDQEFNKIRNVIQHGNDHQWCYYLWNPGARFKAEEQRVLLEWFRQTGSFQKINIKNSGYTLPDKIP